MKHLIIALALASTAPVQAGWRIVSDPTTHALVRSNHLKELGQFLEMVSNQVEQITTLHSQLDQLTTYVDRFGDPEALLEIAGVEELVDSLNTEGLGRSLAELREVADGAEALEYTADGLFKEISKVTDAKVDVSRSTGNYKKYGAIQQASQNYARVHEDVRERRAALKDDLEETATALQASTTDAETQKLSGVLVAQSAELEAVDREVNFAALQAIVQDIENRNEAAREGEATLEDLAADKQDALDKIRAIAVPDHEPTLRFGRSGE